MRSGHGHRHSAPPTTSAPITALPNYVWMLAVRLGFNRDIISCTPLHVV
jgi:hypothetical protein